MAKGKNDYSLFDGYNTNSKRYKTRRKDEQASKKRNLIRVLKKIELELLNADSLSDEEVAVLEKRRDTLRKQCPVENKKDLSQNFIPFRIDHKTVIYIREKHLFKAKWLARLGRPRIEKRLQDYKAILNKKPDGIIYWNPFID